MNIEVEFLPDLRGQLARSDRIARYQVLFDDFRAARKLDASSPMAPTEIDRHFALDDEIPEQRVRALLTQVLASPLVGVSVDALVTL